tara:strand:- start:1937 stop:2245 length:309 start_codon:yes stop_codon:yes gene_type:complete
MKTDTFTDIINSQLILVEEVPVAGEGELEQPPVAQLPAPEAPVDQGSQGLADLAIAAKIALQLDTITPEDRNMLLQQPTDVNASGMRELLSNISGWFDTPQV